MSKIIGNNLPDMPWQEKPAGEHMPVWRYDQNPIIGRYEQKRSNSIFNSAVVPFEDGYADNVLVTVTSFPVIHSAVSVVLLFGIVYTSPKLYLLP